jgi:hypothetical protein
MSHKEIIFMLYFVMALGYKNLGIKIRLCFYWKFLSNINISFSVYVLHPVYRSENAEHGRSEN